MVVIVPVFVLINEYLKEGKKVKRKMKGLMMAILLIYPVIGSGVAMAGEIPLSSDINIVKPDPSLPEEFQAISGKWRGT
jgi:hypothetical protein